MMILLGAALAMLAQAPATQAPREPALPRAHLRLAEDPRLLREVLEDVARQAPGVRSRALFAMRGHAFAEALLAQFLSDRSLSLSARMLVLEVLAGGSAPLPFNAIRSIKSRTKTVEARVDYVSCLARTGPKGIAELEKLLKSREEAVRAEAVYSIATHGGARGIETAAEVLVNRREPTMARVAALRGLRHSGADTAHVEALRRLAGDEPQVMFEALDALDDQPQEGDATYLIDVIASHPGPLAERAAEMLRERTGYKVGTDVRAWRYWLLHHRTQETPFKYIGKVTPSSKGDTLTYMGIPVTGEAVVFLTDASGSMNQQLGSEAKYTRGQRAVKELRHLLPRLREGSSFELIFFAGWANQLNKGMNPKNKTNLARAEEWLSRQAFGGGTNLYQGLHEMMQLEGVTEVFVLTDGDPSVGDIIDMGRIRHKVARWNRWRGVRISTIGIGCTAQGKSFLWKLAKENRGHCVIID